MGLNPELAALGMSLDVKMGHFFMVHPKFGVRPIGSADFELGSAWYLKWWTK